MWIEKGTAITVEVLVILQKTIGIRKMNKEEDWNTETM